MADFAKGNINARQDRVSRIAIAFLAGCVFALSVGLVPSEFSAHKARFAGAQGAYGAASHELAMPVGSVLGVYGKLETCLAALTDLVTLLQPVEKRKRVAQHCLTFANGVLEHSPALSIAQLVKAIASQEIGDVASSRQALLLSEMVAGNRISNAQHRAARWIRQFSNLSDQELAALRRDLARIGDNIQGVRWLAGAYVSNPSLRPIFTQVMKAKPSNVQSDFLSFVRNLGK